MHFSLNFSNAVSGKKVKREDEAHLDYMCVFLIIYLQAKES